MNNDAPLAIGIGLLVGFIAALFVVSLSDVQFKAGWEAALNNPKNLTEHEAWKLSR